MFKTRKRKLKNLIIMSALTTSLVSLNALSCQKQNDELNTQKDENVNVEDNSVKKTNQSNQNNQDSLDTNKTQEQESKVKESENLPLIEVEDLSSIKEDHNKDTASLDPSQASEGSFEAEGKATNLDFFDPNEIRSESKPNMDLNEYAKLDENQRYDVDYEAHKKAYLNRFGDVVYSSDNKFGDAIVNANQYNTQAQKLSQPSKQQAQFLGLSYGQQDPKNNNQTKLLINSDNKPATNKYWATAQGNNGKARYLTNQKYKNIALQTFSIQFINAKPNSKDFQTHFGTAWILDYKLDENGKYPTKWYLATNVHVANLFIKNAQDGNYNSRSMSEEEKNNYNLMSQKLSTLQESQKQITDEYLPYDQYLKWNADLQKFDSYDKSEKSRVVYDLNLIATQRHQNLVKQMQSIENDINYYTSTNKNSTKVTELKAQKSSLLQELNRLGDFIRSDFQNAQKIYLKELINEAKSKLKIQDLQMIEQRHHSLEVQYTKNSEEIKSIEAKMSLMPFYTNKVVLSKFTEDTEINQTLRTTEYDPRSISFIFEPSQVKTVYLALDFLKTSPKDYVHSSYKYLDAEEMADFAVLEIDLENNSNNYEYTQNNNIKNLVKKVQVNDAQELARIFSSDYAKWSKQDQVSFSNKNLYDTYEQDKKQKIKVNNTQVDKYKYNLYALGFPLAQFDGQLQKDFNPNFSSRAVDEIEADNRSTSIWINKPSYLSKGVENEKDLDHLLGKGYNRSLTFRTFKDKPGIVDAIIANPQINGNKPFSLLINSDNNKSGIENFDSSVIQNNKFTNNYYITYGLNYALGSWAPLGGASGSSVRDNDGNVVAINYFANDAALSSLAFAFRSNGINYNGLYGNYNMEKYDLIYGGAPQQRTSYRQALESLYGKNFKSNLFPNGVGQEQIPEEFKFNN
ncbi:DUF31 family protein [Mycoplasmopsis ciconiae]|uniref:DUF31 family protein n=1 Tax=Mycoplasmopsis ciconiae TaxID=561067 RepID=A0ABU7MKY1_9BACT|nr:DUF31 family protein [Mycoplasmopsis ciconiae]